MLTSIKQLFRALREMSAAEWGHKAAKAAVGEVPFVGSFLAELLPPPAKASADKHPERDIMDKQPERDLIVAAFTFDPHTYTATGHGISGVLDEGVGTYSFLLNQPCDEFFVVAEVRGAAHEIGYRDSSMFSLSLFDRAQPEAHVDRPVKVLVLSTMLYFPDDGRKPNGT